MKKGDLVQFKRLRHGKYDGVEKPLYIVEETDLKFGEVNILVKNIKTNEKVYTQDRILILAEDKRVNIQLKLF